MSLFRGRDTSIVQLTIALTDACLLVTFYRWSADKKPPLNAYVVVLSGNRDLY